VVKIHPEVLVVEDVSDILVEEVELSKARRIA
jgi:hypothetical protein